VRAGNPTVLIHSRKGETVLRLTLALAAACAALAAASSTPAAPVPDAAGLLDLPAGYSYSVLMTGCADQERSTESGLNFATPEDPDGKALFKGPDSKLWLLVQHELTQPRTDDFQGDAGKCHVDEQTPGDNDSNGWGSISRLTLAKNGTTVLNREIITTGLHNLCAAAVTPWRTYLTNEEFPFLADPQLTSGWVWEIDPATGKQTRLDGMGRFSHEQEAFAHGGVYLTDDRGDARFIYKFVPDRKRDLTAGKLYGLSFNRATGIGTWLGPLNPLNPDSDMRTRFSQNPSISGFTKAEGIVGTHADGRGGQAVYFAESGAGADPGRVWRLDHLSNKGSVRGRVVVEGDFARLGRPDNLRFSKGGDLFIMEDHSGTDFARGNTGNVNQIWVLPKHKEGSSNLVLFGQTADEPTGPWFSDNGKLLYLSVQADSPRVSHVIAIRAPKTATFNKSIER
jgi:secreted PhoX family phosphatase